MNRQFPTIQSLSGTKVFLISLLASSVLIATLVGVAVWKLKTNYYEALINKEKVEQQKVVTKAQEEVISAERRYTNVSSKLEEEYLNRKVWISNEASDLDRNRTKRGGLLVESKCSKDPSAAPDQTSPDSSASSPLPTEGVCELPKLLSEFLIQTASDADEMRSRLQTAKEYAEQVDSQRAEIEKEQ